MNLTFSRQSLTNCTKRAKYFIARVFGLFLLFFGSAASADLTNDVHKIGIDLETLLADLNTYSSTLDGDLVAIQTALSNYLQPLHQDVVSGNNTLTSILTALNGSSDSSLANRLRDIQYMISGGGGLYQSYNIFSYLNQIAQNTANGGGTNIYNVKVDARDILAGNPWWYTNSTFTLTKGMYSNVYPDGSGQGLAYHSFPQFMSKWSSLLTYPQSSGTVTPANMKNQWFDTFGVSRQPSRTPFSSMWPYTWFDWMADANKSNLVLQAAANMSLDRLASLDPSVNVTNLVSFFSTNFVSVAVSNNFNAEDILAANPWWFTNSAFASTWNLWDAYVPDPRYPEHGLSFAEMISVLASSRLRDTRQVYGWDSFGSSGGPFGDGVNVGVGGYYTFEDWLADYFKSNMVLTTSTSFSNLTSELYDSGYDTDDVSFTNSPLPEYSLPDDSLSEATDALQQGQTTVSGFIDSLPKPGTGGNSEIVVIPEFTVGGIHVSEYRADLSTSIVPVCRQVLSFLYGVSLFCGIFVLAKGEYAFWISWGRYWDRA